jgi:hypothetical protein
MCVCIAAETIAWLAKGDRSTMETAERIDFHGIESLDLIFNNTQHSTLRYFCHGINCVSDS